MQLARNITDEWSELPPSRRHFYFYLCLVLFTLAAKEFQDGVEPDSARDKALAALRESMPGPLTADGNALPAIPIGNNN